jgi:alkanesulfonate monooxygenase SsuD/methylene tetrahydromethanopterin reductase-like flavin-dependent oxidoreductase (luciferase family)
MVDVAGNASAYHRRAATLLRCLGLDVDGPPNESVHHDAFVLQPRPPALRVPWLLGTSMSSMRLAARWGLPFACVHNPNALDAVAEYRRTFRPSSLLAAPRCMISVLGVFGRSAEAAAQHMIRVTDTGAPAVPAFARHEARALFANLIDTYRPDEIVYTDFCADPVERRDTYSAIAEQTADLVIRDGSPRGACVPAVA